MPLVHIKHTRRNRIRHVRCVIQPYWLVFPTIILHSDLPLTNGNFNSSHFFLIVSVSLGWVGCVVSYLRVGTGHAWEPVVASDLPPCAESGSHAGGAAASWGDVS